MLTAFLIGFLGSFHCVGMCGPIALALPASGAGRRRFLFTRLYYNLGRVLTYSFLGAIVGILGSMIHWAGWQQGLSIGTGVLMLLLLATQNTSRSIPFITRGVGKLKAALGGLLQKKGNSTYWLIGALNGFLPCGFVYLALAGALNAASALWGASYMALFGLGTFPLLLSLVFGLQMVPMNWRNRLQKAVPYLAACLALLLILRGLNLGIPYVSPVINHSSLSQTEVEVCH
ncbi:sulfite exporter TauE/SafE family protein [Cytophagales bacterium LB-30]|uniref:Sulfite exporter TauE/SafE family protein n=1 Tax=Shiella aurantiaca TaxID=3058365 RepID=A0ABT8F2A5_9BACT|nr:sulfite exporter TauE/SafE family protein [Shiella aurantiaca]MDN4164581.1 sulfite exporter TauE/SafE family protein [Shiella aurantiaca]